MGGGRKIIGIGMPILRNIRFKWVISLISLSCVFTFTLPSTGYCDDWVYVDRTHQFLYYYDYTNIKINQENNQIKVWIKIKYTEIGRTFVINQLKTNKLNILNIDKLSYSLSLHVIDYKEKIFTILSNEFYSKSGVLLHIVNTFSYGWNNILPGNIIDDILNKIIEDHNIEK